VPITLVFDQKHNLNFTTISKPHPAIDGNLFLEMYKGRQGDKRCFTCRWSGHLAHNCRNRKLVATKEKRGDADKNRWEVLRSHIMRCGVEHVVCCGGWKTKDFKCYTELY